MEKFNRILKSNLLLLLFVPAGVLAQKDPVLNSKQHAEKVDSILIQYYPDGFNGNVLIASHDSVVFRQSYGYSDLSSETPLNDSSVFEINSCSKHFTALAILKLYELKKLDLQDSLKKFFPELPYSGVTVRHLLTHTSGIPYYEWFLVDKDTCTVCGNKDIIADYVRYKPASKFSPGQKFDYCNMNYLLLANIIEQVSGTSYILFLQDSFFKPLGMDHTYIGRKYTRVQPIPNYAHRHAFVKNEYVRPESIKKFRHQVKYDGVLGQNHIHTTTTDLLKWEKGLKDHKILSKETLDMVYDPANFPLAIKTYNTVYGYGCYINTTPNGRVIWQAGGDDGGHSYIYRFIDKNMLLVILSNKSHDDDRDTELAPIVFKGKFFLH